MKQIEQTISSIEVAEMVEKGHNDLLKDIRRYCEQLGQGKIPQSDFFTVSTYQNSQNKTMPCYNVTKKGCEFIAHKLTGIKGTEFTAKYINRFHEMKSDLNQPKSPLQLLELEFAAIKEVDSKVDAVSKDLQDFKQDLPILWIEEDRITSAVKRKGVSCLGGKKSNAYSDRSLRGKLYSDLYQQLYRHFGINTYKAIKRSQCDLAVKVIEEYEPPFILAEQIADCNAQTSMEVA